MKIKRSTKEYGSGSGRTTFESDMFTVTLWDLTGGKKTTIKGKFHNWYKIEFDGEHIFDSDEKCFEQFTLEEIIMAIQEMKTSAFKAGKQSKITEIKNCLCL